MVTFLVLVVLVGFVIQQQTRLRRIEERLDDFDLGHAFAPTASEPAVAEPAAPQMQDEPLPATTTELAVIAVHDEPSFERESESVEVAEADEEDERKPWALGIGFEELFGRRLPIWAGGITLAVAGMLIVKLSIESGLLTPPIRVISGLAFGAALIAGAELASRLEARIRDVRVRQALAGAGIASLYASILVAVNLYQLVSPVTAMVGMAAVTALAMFLSTRFGAPSALLGLAGGLAAPALVGSTEPNVPLLSIYLALAVSGLCALSRNQRWAWLGISAMIGGFGWGIVLLLGRALDAPSSISLGLYLLLLGVAIPALGFAGERKDQLHLVAAIVAAAQMAALVATGGFALLNWGLFALLSAAIVWLAERHVSLARLPAVGLLIALLLLGAWTAPQATNFALVMSGIFLIYGVPATWRLWRRGGLVEAAEIGAVGLGGLLLPMFHFHHADGSNDLVFGLLALGLSIFVGGCAAIGWTKADRTSDARFALLGTVTAVLLGAAVLLLLPVWAAAVAIGLLGIALLELGWISRDSRFEPIAWIFAAAGCVAYPYAQAVDGVAASTAIDTLHWAFQAAIAAWFAWRGRFPFGRAAAQALAPVFLYVAAATPLPSQLEPLIGPALLAATVLIGRRIDQRLIPAMASCTAIILAWALWPLLLWSGAAVESLGGAAMLVTDVPSVLDSLKQLLVPSLAIAAATIAAVHLRPLERRGGWAIAGLLIGVGAHSLYKHVFAIATTPEFVSLGMAERTTWEALLAGLAVLALRFGKPWGAATLAIACAAHLTLYTLLLHNPLWAEQAVGRWPLVNWLLPAYALAFVLSVAAKREVAAVSAQAARVLTVMQMILAVLFAFSELRQLFHGSLLTAPGLPVAEDILRSILAIALAIGFLLWGIVRQQRDWRIASLALMLAAVVKVFLFDASGLEGVTRIASFVALGFSLIGIGWLYARQLGTDKAALPA
ncbi:DUF2339 domain-containing protein [Sphingomonas sp. URHD0057]|uniref:DUF2339 domain-containing protein n=1 Tax=Sphingomonas sp. URHD0057 TaxID=1380389 RepID=UPI000491986F|nr:DUF2339 domain-containing protein [Sphingomonas sp. URHD0057]